MRAFAFILRDAILEILDTITDAG